MTFLLFDYGPLRCLLINEKFNLLTKGKKCQVLFVTLILFINLLNIVVILY